MYSSTLDRMSNDLAKTYQDLVSKYHKPPIDYRSSGSSSHAATAPLSSRVLSEPLSAPLPPPPQTAVTSAADASPYRSKLPQTEDLVTKNYILTNELKLLEQRYVWHSVRWWRGACKCAAHH